MKLSNISQFQYREQGDVCQERGCNKKEQPFESSSGRKARYPGDFNAPAEDCFAEFERKYLQATQTVEKIGKNGIITAEKLAVPIQKQKAPDKAKAFELILGYTKDNAAELLQSIFDHADESRFVEGNSEYGIRYGYIMELKDPNRKKAKVVIAWIRENGKLRLTSVYITGRKGTE